jgi:hypothetical protein
MSDKGLVGVFKMSAAVVIEAKTMADFILHRVHRGPGDTVDAAMHRAERLYGVPSEWLHRLRYRDLKDVPGSVLLTLFNAYRAASDHAERAYQKERQNHDAHSALVGLADLVAGKEAQKETVK